MADQTKLGRLCDPMILRFILIVWGLLTLLVSSVAHFTSGWSQKKGWVEDQTVYFYNVCSNWEDRRKGADPDTAIRYADKYQPGPCPHISMEYYYIAAIILSLLGSIVSAVLNRFVIPNRETKKDIFELADCILHGVLALLLLIGVITFIVSAMQAQDVAIYYSSLDEDRELDKDTLGKIGMGYEVKLFAAALGVVQVILHLILFVMALIPIIRNWRDKKKGNEVAPEATPASQQGKAEKPKPEPEPKPKPPPPPRKSEGKPRGSKKSKG